MTAEPLPDPLRSLFEREGRLSFEEFMELALYDPAVGFFATGGSAGRRTGDFITSPEVGPLFGAVVSRWLDRVWEELDRPDRFQVVELGAGRGALALSVRAASPRCAAALEYTLVERSDVLRQAQADHLPLGGGVRELGPRFQSAADLPDGPITGVVLGNELLDNLPCRLARRRGSAWVEVAVELGPAGELVEGERPLGEADSDRCESLAPDARPGATIPLQDRAAVLVADVLARISRGRLVLFDYGSTTAEISRRPLVEWLRTYRSHQRGVPPLKAVGQQDITVEVALDQLPGGPVVTGQREWLEANGIEGLVQEARRQWRERAGVGDLRAMRARSVPVEAVALCDPDGLGAFRVVEWQRDLGGEP